MAIGFQQDYPETVAFEQRDGVYWLTGYDLRRFEAVTNRNHGCTAIGFDEGETMAHALDLLGKGISVAIREGATFRLLSEPPESVIRPPKTQTVFLSPELLIDRSDLERLAASLGRPRCRLRACFERWRSMLMNDERGAEPVYVVRLCESMYEVAWEWTGLSEESFLGLALAAETLGRKLSCRLISGRPARLAPRARAEPPVYGQLTLSL